MCPLLVKLRDIEMSQVEAVNWQIKLHLKSGIKYV